VCFAEDFFKIFFLKFLFYMDQPKIFKGITGYVEVYPDRAIKYTEFTQLYWLREYSILTYLSKYNNSNTAVYDAVEYKKINGKLFFVAQMPNYGKQLCDISGYSDHLILQMLLDISTSLTLLHSKNIIHRDIKPENIMIKGSRATLIDFTHSVHFYKNSTRLIDPAVFTYIYRPPEITAFINAINEKRPAPIYGSAADMWSLGAVLFEVVTGRALYSIFKVNSEAACAAAFTSKGFLSKVKKNYTCKHKYAEFYLSLILNLLDPEPERRQTATALCDRVIKLALQTKDYVLPRLVCRQLPHNVSLGDIDPQIRQLAIQYLASYKFTATSDVLDLWINYFIDRRVMTRENCASMVAAIGIVADAVIFDNLGDIYHSSRKTTLAAVCDCIEQIMEHREDLFINMWL
jgi:serine/threonine protein kinase